MDIVMQFISSLGFPIVACYFLYDYIKKRDETFTKEREMYMKIIENNTRAIQELSEKIEGRFTDAKEK